MRFYSDSNVSTHLCIFVKPLINSYCDIKILKSLCAVLNFDPNYIGSQEKVFIEGTFRGENARII